MARLDSIDRAVSVQGQTDTASAGSDEAVEAWREAMIDRHGPTKKLY